MRRPKLEVADVFHRHGADWRQANAGHVSLGQLRVMSAIEQYEATVRDGNAMGIPGEVGEYCFWPGEGRPGIDKPVLFPERREMRGEGLAVTHALDLAKECQPARHVGIGKRGQEKPPEQAGQHPHRYQEPGLAMHPARPSSDIPPPGTIMWTCGWWVIAEPQVWGTAVAPIRASRCLRSAAIVSSVWAAVRNSRL